MQNLSLMQCEVKKGSWGLTVVLEAEMSSSVSLTQLVWHTWSSPESQEHPIGWTSLDGKDRKAGSEPIPHRSSGSR